MAPNVNLKRRIKFWLLTRLGVPLMVVALRMLRLTLRWTRDTSDLDQTLAQHGRGIYAFWHGDSTAVVFAAADRPRKSQVVVMVSPSRDGEVLARIVPWFKGRAVRGSSASRAVAGLKQLASELDEGHDVALAVDGPRGPYHEVKPGIALLAKLAQSPILPMSVRYSSAWTFGSWDRFRLPKPFSRVEVIHHPPLIVPPDADKQALERVCRELTELLGD